MARVLVTGGSGKLGRAVLKALFDDDARRGGGDLLGERVHGSRILLESADSCGFDPDWHGAEGRIGANAIGLAVVGQVVDAGAGVGAGHLQLHAFAVVAPAVGQADHAGFDVWRDMQGRTDLPDA